jgi:hypothetical protein
MPTTYTPAEPEIYTLAESIITHYYPELREAEVTLLIQMAFAPRNEETGEPKGPALTHGGYPAAAVVRVTKLEDRVAGLPDARIKLDGDHWDEWSQRERTAIIHHEINHLELVVDEEGNVQGDDIGRPKLRLRKHDHQIGAFDNIMRIYGDDAPETRAAAALVRSAKEGVGESIEELEEQPA